MSSISPQQLADVVAQALAAIDGASVTAARVIVTVVAETESTLPSEAFTVKLFAPFSFAAGT